MTPEQIRIAIAESLGWEDVSAAPLAYHFPGTVHGSKDGLTHRTDIPNWPEDLNACHELEKTLTAEELKRYNRFLITSSGKPDYGDWSAKHYDWHSSALQRCEAYLRVRNLWRD